MAKEGLNKINITLEKNRLIKASDLNVEISKNFVINIFIF